MADDISVAINGDPQDFIGALDEAGVSVDKFSKKIKNSGEESNRATSGGSMGFMKWAGVIAAGAAVIGGAMKGIGAAAEKEQFATQFETLLGSADAAQERIAELSKFANATPFSNVDVMTMSKSLQAMTNGALASGDGLKLVGDTAAALGPEKIDQFAMHIGRAYGAIKSGASFGESIQELTQLGAIGMEAGQKLKAISESGKVGEEAWTLLEAELKKNDGAMARLAGTFGGAASTMKGTFTDVMADAFAPVTSGLVDVMFDFVDGMEAARPVLVAIGAKIGEVVTGVRNSIMFMWNAFKGGDLGDLLLTGLKLGGAMFVNWFFGALKAGFDILLGVVTGVLATVASMDFWMGVVKAFMSLQGIMLGLVMILGGGLMQAAQNWWSSMMAAAGTVSAILGSAASLAGLTLFGWILKGVEKLIAVGQKLNFPGMDAMAEKVIAARKGVEGLAEGAKQVLSDPKAIYDGLKETAAAGMDAAGAALVKQGKEIVAKGMEAGGEGLAQAGGAVKEGFEGKFDDVKFEPADIINTDGMRAEAGDLLSKHWPKDKAEETKENAASTGEAIKKAVDPSVIADSMAKIGGGGNVFMAAISAAKGGSSDVGLGGAGGLSPSGGLEGAGSASGALGDSGSGGSAQLAVLNDMLTVMRSVRDILSSGGDGGGGGLTISLV